MAREKLDTQVRQEQITRAALKVIARLGLHGLTLAAVADEVGIVSSAIYRHFEGRAAVVDAALRLVAGRLRDNVTAVRLLTPDPVERLRLLLERHLCLLMENPGILRLVFSEEVLSEPQRRLALYRSIQAYLAEVATLVREAQTGGQIRPELDSDTVAGMFLGLIQPAALLWQLSAGEFDLLAHGMRAWKILERALAPCNGTVEAEIPATDGRQETQAQP